MLLRARPWRPLPSSSASPRAKLDIIAWPGYVERGETDKEYDWVTQFEKDTGCKVNVKTAGTSDEMVALMNAGRVRSRHRLGRRQPAPDPRQAPCSRSNLGPDPQRAKTVDERLQEAPWHYVDGKHYGVPYQWGPNVLMYNTNVFKKPPTSWSVVFEPQKLPDGKPNKGRVQAYDGPIYIADAALYLMTKKPELGIKDPYELNETQYAAALDVLREQHPLIQRYWHDATVQVQDFTNEGIVASSSWPLPGQHAAWARSSPSRRTIPAEGATGWADTTMMHAEREAPELRVQVAGVVAHPEGAGRRGRVVRLRTRWCRTPARATRCSGAEGCKTNGIENFDKIHFWRTPEAKCATPGRQCVPYSKWATDYVAIMGGR